MTEIWNNKQLVGPPFVTVATKIKKSDLRLLAKTMHRLLTHFEDSEYFDTAAAFLSRIICINCAQFRRMELLRHMKQTNQALLRLKNFPIVQFLEDFKAYIPSEIAESQKIHLPTRQYLEFLLVRLQGVARLLCRVIICAQKTGRNCLQLVSIGNFFAKNAIFLSIIGQVVAAAKNRLEIIIQSYDNLVKLREILKNGKFEWLPVNYELPHDLKEWLGDNYPHEPAKDEKTLESLSVLENLISMGDDDEPPEDTEIDENLKMAFEEVVKDEPDDFGSDFIKFSTESEAVGEVVAREETLEDRLLSIKTASDIQNFIKNEENARMRRDTNSFLAKISKKEFAKFKHESNRLMKAFSGKSLVKKFKQEINKFVK
ncbi:uncharacterized protein LOC134827193 [Culicoides brevitarsis]|uniref:uncharacterized protein LOC134827193 n=1 Tax=Culicoides brevitarsis TaxID=469753 RepID=UPI00307C5076